MPDKGADNSASDREDMHGVDTPYDADDQFRKGEPKVEVKPRLTVREDIYHESPDGRGRTVGGSSFSEELREDEEVYERTMKLTQEWVKADTGWLSSCSMLRLENVESNRTGKNPSEAERKSLSDKVIEIAFAQPTGEDRTMHDPEPAEPWACMTLSPGRSMRIYPSDVSAVLLRSRSGVTKCFVSVVPK